MSFFIILFYFILCFTQKPMGIKYNTINSLYIEQYHKIIKCYIQNFNRVSYLMEKEKT